MTAARYDLTIDQGSNFSLELTVKENGEAKTLTKWHGRAQLRKNKEDSTAAASFAFNMNHDEAGNQPADKTGKMTMSLPYKTEGSQVGTSAIPAGIYHYDVEIYYNNSSTASTDDSNVTQVKRLFGGTATVTREITR